MMRAYLKILAGFVLVVSLLATIAGIFELYQNPLLFAGGVITMLAGGVLWMLIEIASLLEAKSTATNSAAAATASSTRG